MSYPTTTYAGVAHPSFAAYAAFEELTAVYGDDAFRRAPIIGKVHGPYRVPGDTHDRACYGSHYPRLSYLNA
jgi:hypothetical protein